MRSLLDSGFLLNFQHGSGPAQFVKSLEFRSSAYLLKPANHAIRYNGGVPLPPVKQTRMASDSSHSATTLIGELIVRDGPDRGTSRALLVPFTLLGSAEHCDLRILDFLVRPVHCAVSVTPDGPHLRSLGGTTLVNGVPTGERLLQSGDIVTVGPVNLEVHWYLPPAPLPNDQAIKPASLLHREPAAEAGGNGPPPRKIARMRRRLAHGRLTLLRERLALRTDTARQLLEVRELRTEGERLKIEAGMELTELRALRRRFLRQWRRYWRRKQEQFDTQRADLERERAEVIAHRQRVNDEYARFDAERTELTQAHDACRQRCQRLEHDLAERTADLVAREARLQEQQTQLARDAMLADQLRDEVRGLEARIQHLRSELPAPPPPVLPEVPPVAERTLVLEQLTQTLADQQRALQRQLTALADAQQVQDALAEELEQLAVQLVQREEVLSQAERFQHMKREQLECWQARLLDQQIAVEQREATVERQQRTTQRHDDDLDRLCQQWSERRRQELARLQAEAQQLAALRGHLAQQRQTLAQRDAELGQQIDRVAAEQRATGDDRAIQRWQARLAQRSARHSATLHTIRTEADALETLYAQTQQQLLALAALQRDFAEQQVAMDRSAHTQQRRLSEPLALVSEQQQALREAHGQIAELRDEVQRLTKLLEQRQPPRAEQRRAA